ncbi:hypothetical protein ACFL5U_00460 [Candidatus Margulisiibacteriota bacterium]
MRNLYDEIKIGSDWEKERTDEFPSSVEWKNEVIRWLNFIYSEGQFDKFKPRLRSKGRQRDETFAEIASAYYLCKKLNFQINDWEPPGANNTLGEFYVTNKTGIKVFCEVKSPGWEAAIYRENKNITRIKQQKFIGVECRSFDNSIDIKYLIEKYYPKFPKTEPSLLIIVDDFHASNNSDNYFGVKKALFRQKLPPSHVDNVPEGAFVNNRFKNLSSVACLNYQLPCKSNIVTYHWKVFENPFARNKLQSTVFN